MSIPSKIASVVVFLLAATAYSVPASFTTTGNLGTARSNHTATLLPNGKVLIAGGVGLSSAEIYDPATGAFTPTGSMAVARSLHTATLLPNGKVLVAGGAGAAAFQPSLTSAELYDPATGTFTNTGTMNSPREGHTASLLANGKVLFAGGDNGITSLATAELYDPSAGANGTFTVTASMNGARAQHTATVLAGGKVLIAGGVASLNTINSAEIFDPAAGPNGSFTTTANMIVARTGHSSTLLTNGKVLVMSGGSGELFDPAAGANGTFTSAPSSPIVPATYHTATLLPNGKVLLAGGKGTSGVTPNAELYDPAGSFTLTTAPMSFARYNHTATLLPNGSVLIAGGYNDTAYLNTAELYPPVTGTPFAATTGAMQTVTFAHTSTLLRNGKVLIAGGGIGSSALDTAELYDPATGTFTATSGTMTSSRRFHTATLLLNGKVLLTGGYSNSSGFNTAELYDPASATPFTAISAPMTTGRLFHTATLLPDGKVLIAGGYNGNPLNTAEVFDPATGTFTATNSTMTTPHSNHTATLLFSGKVLITGGYSLSNTQYTDQAELYDPATGTFTATSHTMWDPRYGQTATLLPNSKVLIAGGYDSDLAGAEIYDPADGSFTDTSARMTTLRRYHTATLLPNGKVLIAGGQNSSGATLFNSAELYDPASGTFTATSSPMASARSYDSATLLEDGKVLVAGGFGATPSSAELFDAGLGFSDARRTIVSPVINAVCQPGNLALSGSHFMGDSEGSSGSTSSSANNVPLLRLQRVDSEQLQFVRPQTFSPSTFFSATLSNLSSGQYRTVIVSNAIPSVEQIIDVETTPLLGTYASTTVNLLGSTVVNPTSLPAGYNATFYPQTVTAPAFTGTFSINATTGAISIANAGPVGDYTITVSSSTNCGSPSTTFALAVLGSPSAVTAFAGTPQAAQVSTPFATALQARVTDSAGHTLNNIGVTFTAPPGGASATFPGGGSAVTNASGIATIVATANGSLGSYNASAVVGSSTATFALTNSPATPSSVLATATTSTSVLITWNGTAGATYEVQRIGVGGAITTIGSSGSGSLTNTTAQDVAFLYQVHAIAPNASPFSPADLATTVIFTDATLTPGVPIKAAHVNELRNAVDAVRKLAGLNAGVYSDPTLGAGTIIKRAHIIELRNALDEARGALALVAITYTRPIVSGTTIAAAADINDLRNGVR